MLYQSDERNPNCGKQLAHENIAEATDTTEYTEQYPFGILVLHMGPSTHYDSQIILRCDKEVQQQGWFRTSSLLWVLHICFPYYTEDGGDGGEFW